MRDRPYVFLAVALELLSIYMILGAHEPVESIVYSVAGVLVAFVRSRPKITVRIRDFDYTAQLDGNYPVEGTSMRWAIGKLLVKHHAELGIDLVLPTREQGLALLERRGTVREA